MTETLLILTNCYPPIRGGVETFLTDYISCINKHGKFDVKVITFSPNSIFGIIHSKYDDNLPTTEKREGLEVRRIKFRDLGLSKLGGRGYPLLSFLLSFEMFCTSLTSTRFCQDICIIHAQDTPSAMASVLLAAIFRKKKILSLHNIYSYSNSFLIKRILARMFFSSFDQIVVSSKKMMNELLKINISRKKFSVIPYWIDLDKFKVGDKEQYKNKLGLKGKFVVLFVGRLFEYKGVKQFVNVAQDFKDEKDVFFLIVPGGGGPLEDYVISMAKKLPNLKVQFQVPSEDMPFYYNCADVTVFPSTYEEGFGRVLIESLACNTPVIASRRGSIPEIINDSVGVLVEPSIYEISNAIRLLHDKPELLKKLKQNCRLRAEEAYSEKNFDMYIKLFESLLQ